MLSYIYYYILEYIIEHVGFYSLFRTKMDKTRLRFHVGDIIYVGAQLCIYITV